MSHLSNRTILEKADLALADLTAGGGCSSPRRRRSSCACSSSSPSSCSSRPSSRWPRQAADLEDQVRRARAAPRPGGHRARRRDRVKPDLSDVELDAKLFKAEVRLSDEVLEDSIERGELRQTIMEMLADAIARDMEEVAINGDTASADPFLATMDGILKQATSNVVDAAGTPITKDLLRDC
jgi:hypothetical protein